MYIFFIRTRSLINICFTRRGKHSAMIPRIFLSSLCFHFSLFFFNVADGRPESIRSCPLLRYTTDTQHTVYVLHIALNVLEIATSYSGDNKLRPKN